jgi:hypothetical protein
MKASKTATLPVISLHSAINNKDTTVQENTGNLTGLQIKAYEKQKLFYP